MIVKIMAGIPYYDVYAIYCFMVGGQWLYRWVRLKTRSHLCYGILWCGLAVGLLNHVLDVMEKRSSARAYSDERLTREELDTILTAGLQAPTATNRKEIRFSVINDDNPALDELEAEMSAGAS